MSTLTSPHTVRIEEQRDPVPGCSLALFGLPALVRSPHDPKGRLVQGHRLSFTGRIPECPTATSASQAGRAEG